MAFVLKHFLIVQPYYMKILRGYSSLEARISTINKKKQKIFSGGKRAGPRRQNFYSSPHWKNKTMIGS